MMDFLKKAKKTMKDLETDLNKATAALGLNNNAPQDTSTDQYTVQDNFQFSSDNSQYTAQDNIQYTTQDTARDTAQDTSPGNSQSIDQYGSQFMAAASKVQNGSARSTPASTAMNTPATSVAPSSVGGVMRAKLPLAVRKSLRDDWESNKPMFEAEISGLLGIPWTVPIDYSTLYPLAETELPKENPGKMLSNYISSTITNLKLYVDKYGNDGKAELNRTAFTHTILLAETSNPKISVSGCEIANGSFLIVFAKGRLGYNINDATWELSTAVNSAGSAADASALGDTASALDFDARSNIKACWDPKVTNLQAEIGTTLGLPFFTLTPNFERNAAALAWFEKTNPKMVKKDIQWQKDWRARIGEWTIRYFEACRDYLLEAGFDDDEMLREGFKDAVENNEIQLRVVDKLVKGTYNEVVIENGVLVIQTLPKWWATNHRDPIRSLVDML